MYSIVGSYLPFARTEAERQKLGGGRRASRSAIRLGDYAAGKKAANELHRRGLLLTEDVERYIAAAKNAD